ncbi:MAG: hypothetical protein AAB610_01240 [Patescibacteria group bacterium]
MRHQATTIPKRESGTGNGRSLRRCGKPIAQSIRFLTDANPTPTGASVTTTTLVRTSLPISGRIIVVGSRHKYGSTRGTTFQSVVSRGFITNKRTLITAAVRSQHTFRATYRSSRGSGLSGEET